MKNFGKSFPVLSGCFNFGWTLPGSRHSRGRPGRTPEKQPMAARVAVTLKSQQSRHAGSQSTATKIAEKLPEKKTEKLLEKKQKNY